nr:GxxExxY protein [Rhodospirillales bacterium]
MTQITQIKQENQDVGRRDEQTYAVIGAAMAVHRELGHGFLESVYYEALAKEFLLARIPFEREASFAIRYRGEVLNATFRVDFICFQSLIVEIKALHRLSGTEEAQVMNYLKASSLQRARLINF